MRPHLAPRALEPCDAWRPGSSSPLKPQGESPRPAAFPLPFPVMPPHDVLEGPHPSPLSANGGLLPSAVAQSLLLALSLEGTVLLGPLCYAIQRRT